MASDTKKLHWAWGLPIGVGATWVGMQIYGWAWHHEKPCETPQDPRYAPKSPGRCVSGVPIKVMHYAPIPVLGVLALFSRTRVAGLVAAGTALAGAYVLSNLKFG